MITKAGGLIVSEVLARGTPMIVIDPIPGQINPIPGQEEWNADYVAGSGAVIQLRQPESVPPAALSHLAQPGRLVTMRRQALRAGRPRAAPEAAECVLAELRSGRYA